MFLIRGIVQAGLLTMVAILPARADCEAASWQPYKDVQLRQFPGSNAYFYATRRIAIDADGAPNAYHPDNIGLDANANAGYPNGSWHSVLVVDPNDNTRPYVQSSGKFVGYFLSKTSLEDKTRPATDPARYVDSTSVPYMVFPGKFYQMSGTGMLGDIAMVWNLSNQQHSAAIVADRGPSDAPLGEVSIRLAENLGGSNVNPRNGSGAPSGTFVYVVFPKSKAAPPWPLTPDQMNQIASKRLAELGGWDRIAACLQ